MSATRRPWKVFVRDIGPTFSYATAERAHAKARTLIEPPDAYATVIVYNVYEMKPFRQWVYRYDQPEPAERVMDASTRYQWREAS